MKKRDDNRKKSWGGIAGTVFLLLISMAGSEGGAVFAGIIILVAVAAVMIIVGKKLGTAAVNSSNTPAGRAKRIFESSAWNKDVPEEDVFVAKAPEIRSYDENAAEKNFIRDKERRIRQLDGFLKNGIIDKNEYRVLRDRYEKSKY